jgi:hypothetical protein
MPLDGERSVINLTGLQSIEPIEREGLCSALSSFQWLYLQAIKYGCTWMDDVLPIWGESGGMPVLIVYMDEIVELSVGCPRVILGNHNIPVSHIRLC